MPLPQTRRQVGDRSGVVAVHGLVVLDPQELRVVRRMRGHSLDALAARLSPGVTRQQLIDYEAGRRRPDPPRMVALAAALGVPPERLAGIAPEQARLADLRHWAGLTAQAAADTRLFGFSRWSLLRAEDCGRLPVWSSREAFIIVAAYLYRRPRPIVAAALARAPLRGPCGDPACADGWVPGGRHGTPVRCLSWPHALPIPDALPLDHLPS